MIEVVDRVPTYPGRVKLTPVSGQANTYDMVRADEPVEEGTPINKALFQLFIDEINAIRQQVEDKLLEISQRTRLGDLVSGTEIGLYENGVLVPFIVLTASSSSPVVVRKSCVISDVLMDTGDEYYEDCRIDLWLNNEYPLMLDAVTRSVIFSVAVKVSGLFGAENITRKVFLLSYDEYNLASYGGGYSYFSSPERRIATLNGAPVKHWLRSSKDDPSYIDETGAHVYGTSTTATTLVAGIRPAFTLPADYEVTVLASGI